jgi:hypothetical protein
MADYRVVEHLTSAARPRPPLAAAHSSASYGLVPRAAQLRAAAPGARAGEAVYPQTPSQPNWCDYPRCGAGTAGRRRCAVSRHRM